ncbi:MAG: D-aminoacylase [Negativicutes bacterium]|nr:D-aminoacylase [Negativicutes bacterium]
MYDLVIENGRILDGSGNPWFSGDVGIKDGKIARIGRLSGEKAAERIDAAGLYVSPGFIDIHSHSDAVPLMAKQNTGKLLQGVTMEVVGVCGVTMTPLSPENAGLLQKYCAPFFTGADLKWDWPEVKDFLARVEAANPIVNFAFFVGHGTLRIAAMGVENREPTADELARMKELAVQAVKQGAYGMSSGLVYPPGIFAKPEEIIEICKAIAPLGAVYETHIRNETDQVVEAVQEAIEVAEKAGIPVQIAHHKTAGIANWGKSAQTLKLISEARDRGLDITYDVYPYVAASTTLVALLPPWMHEGGIRKLLGRLESAENRARITKELEEGVPGWQNFYKAAGWDKIVVSSAKKNKSYEGKTIVEIAKGKGVEPAEALFELLLEEDGEVLMVLFMMSEEDVTAILQHPAAMVGSDGIFSAGKPHPRYYGTFPRILSKYVRNDKALSLEDAVRKMTSFPAQRLNIHDRGLLKEGMWADITVFDAALVEDKATYLEPQQAPAGIEYVLVNGRMAVKRGEYTGVLAGKVLRK